MATFVEKLAALMEKNGKMTVVQLAAKAGLDRTVLQRLSTGDRTPTSGHLEKLAAAFGVPETALRSDEFKADDKGAAESVIARFLHDHPQDLTKREQQWLEDYRHRVDSESQISENDVWNLLRVIREVYTPSRH